jgi:hypothetical protein
LNVEPAALNYDVGRVFLPSRLNDNPHLDGDEYRRSLVHLDPLSRERLLNGDWSVQEQGLIRPQWLRYYVSSPTFHVGQIDQPAPHSARNEHAQRRPGSLPAHTECGPTLDLLLPDGRSLAQVRPDRCRRFITVDPAGTSADRAREARGRPPSRTVAQVWDQPRGELSQFLILRHQVCELLGFDEIVAVLSS